MKLSRLRDVLGVVILGLPVLGCTGLVWSRQLDLNNPGNSRSGMAYSLPKDQILLVAQRAPANLGALETAVTNAANDLAAVQKTPTGGTPPLSSSPAVAAATATLAAATANRDLLAPLKNGTRVPLSQETVTLTALPFAPDPTARYVAGFQHLPWRNDNLGLTVANGLLNSSALVSQDQTPAIVESIASTIISLTTGLPLLGGAPRAPAPIRPAAPTPPSCQYSQYSLSEVFDPTIGVEVAKVNASLAKMRGDSYLTIQVDIPGTTTPNLTQPPPPALPTFSWNPPSSPAPSTMGAAAVPPAQTELPDLPVAEGLFYRIAMPVIVTANYDPKAAASGAACPIASIPAVTPVNIVVPDSRPGQEMRVAASAGWLTTTTIGLTFTNGMLTDRSIQRPSEILALVGIPADIISQYTSILTNFLQLRVNYATADATIATQRANALAAQITQLQSLATMALAGPTASANAQLALLQNPTETANVAESACSARFTLIGVSATQRITEIRKRAMLTSPPVTNITRGAVSCLVKIREHGIDFAAIRDQTSGYNPTSPPISGRQMSCRRRIADLGNGAGRRCVQLSYPQSAHAPSARSLGLVIHRKYEDRVVAKIDL